ncbi:hypothetical protein BTH160X_170059 [Brochothrix thermosphacta]|nr:hypothetical protein BTH160X_170059 [Brochothrix thermosphacta]
MIRKIYSFFCILESNKNINEGKLAIVKWVDIY